MAPEETSELEVKVNLSRSLADFALNHFTQMYELYKKGEAATLTDASKFSEGKRGLFLSEVQEYQDNYYALMSAFLEVLDEF